MRIRVNGESLDGAINNAMIELSTTSDNISYELIQEGSSGFLGFGAKPYIIEAYRKDDKEEIYKIENANKKEKLVEKSDGIYEFKSQNNNLNQNKNNDRVMTRDPEEVFNRAKEFLTPIFNEFNTTINIDYVADIESNTVNLNISGEKIGVLIGKHGATLDAIQHLVNIVVNNGETNRVRVRIDSENYRDKRNKTLESLAKSVAKTVRKTHKSYEFEPMTSYERRIIHSILQKEKNIETMSKGTEKNRHVVVRFRR